MDERTLNDLLECSVCLERLDVTSKVLPCQHTFCRKCLEEIVASHIELRCPECRVLVELKINDLPPNVLLMRILEGIKNTTLSQKPSHLYTTQPLGNQKLISSIVKKDLGIESSIVCSTNLAKNTAQESNYRTEPESVIKQNNECSDGARLNQMQFQIASVQNANNIQNVGTSQILMPHAIAIYDFQSSEHGDLVFKKGDKVFLRRRVDANWFVGECNGPEGVREGVFPINYVKVIVPLSQPQCKAIYDFDMGPNEEEGCLKFKKGAIISVIRRVDQNWAEGRIGDNIGIFPISFVEMNSLAKLLMEVSNKSIFVAAERPYQLNVPVKPNLSVGSTSIPPISTIMNSEPPAQNILPSSSATNVDRDSKTMSRLLKDISLQSNHKMKTTHSKQYTLTKPCSSKINQRNKQNSDPTQKCSGFLSKHVASTTTENTANMGNHPNKKLNKHSAVNPPPELPPRSNGPSSSIWTKPIGHVEALFGTSSTVNLIKRITNIKRAKSPTIQSAPTYSMDNPVFEDSTAESPKRNAAIHVRSGSCPSKLTLNVGSTIANSNKAEAFRSHRIKPHKERSSLQGMSFGAEMNHKNVADTSSYHRKSHSLDAATIAAQISSCTSSEVANCSKRRSFTHDEKFKCIVSYPPSSGIELGMAIGDIVYVHKKRENGWYKGTHAQTGKVGLFPSSFVEPII